MRGDRTIRGTVKPYWREKQRLWFARGWIPERKTDGRIARRRIERGPGSPTRSACKGLCDQLNKLYEDRAAAVRKPLTFARAVTNYLAAGGEARFLSDGIVTRLGPRLCSDIDDTVMVDLARELYPTATPATLNRQLYTPIVAVLGMAAKGGHCPKPNLTRPKGHDKSPPIEIPGAGWFEAMAGECRPNLWALLLTLTLHGRRPKEMLTLPRTAFDANAGTLSIPDSKTGDPVFVRLAPICIEAIQAMKHKHDNLFGYYYTSRRNVLRAIARAAKRAGVEYHGAHAIGRHSFATRLLKHGMSVKHVADGGGWSDGKMVMRRYGHLAKSEVSDAVKEVGTEWGQALTKTIGNNVVKADFKGKKRHGKRG